MQPKSQLSIFETDPQHLVERGLPHGVPHVHNSPAVEIDESILIHVQEPVTMAERQCWAVGVYDRATSTTSVRVVGPTRTSEVMGG